MLSRQLLVQLFWDICNTMQLKKPWFNILLHCIHFHSFVHFSALQQFRCWQLLWFCVSSNVKYRVWSLIVSVTTGEGCAVYLQWSEADGNPWDGQHPLGWAGPPQAIQQVSFAKLVLQGLPPNLYCPFDFILIFKPLCWREYLNTRKSFFDWSHRIVRGYAYADILGTLKGLGITSMSFRGLWMHLTRLI